MRASFLNGSKRSYYVRELMEIGIREIEGKPLHEVNDKDLRRALALSRAVGS